MWGSQSIWLEIQQVEAVKVFKKLTATGKTYFVNLPARDGEMARHTSWLVMCASNYRCELCVYARWDTEEGLK